MVKNSKPPRPGGTYELIDSANGIGVVHPDVFDRLSKYNPWFCSVLEDIAETTLAKGADYNKDTPFDTFIYGGQIAEISPEKSILSQIGVKISRILSLFGSGKTEKNESREDTLLDLSVYILLYFAYTRMKEEKDES